MSKPADDLPPDDHRRGGFGTGTPPALAVRTIIAFILCVAAGFLATWLRVPLAWILGPLVVAAILSISGISFWTPIFGQRLGQFTVGLSVGLNIKGAVVVALAPLIPAMLLLGVGAIMVGAVVSTVFARVARVDHKTAYFAMMPGGMVEMANVGASIGARHEPIALTQAMRVALVVCLLPPLILVVGTPGNDFTEMHAVDLSPPLIAVAVMAGLVGVAAARICRLNNHWMIGALIGAGVISAVGLVDGKMPTPIFWAGQFLLGITIGARFQREIVLRLLRYALVSAGAIVLLLSCLLGSGGLLAWLTELDFATAALATAPGGVPEMAVTAQVMHLNVALITTFQLVRAFMINAFATHIFAILTRAGLFRLGERILGKP